MPLEILNWNVNPNRDWFVRLEIDVNDNIIAGRPKGPRQINVRALSLGRFVRAGFGYRGSPGDCRDPERQGSFYRPGDRKLFAADRHHIDLLTREKGE